MTGHAEMPKRSLPGTGNASKKKKVMEGEDSSPMEMQSKLLNGTVVTNPFRDSCYATLKSFLMDHSSQKFDSVTSQMKQYISTLEEEDVAERKAIVDQILRDFLSEVVLKGDGRENWQEFLELSIKLAKQEVCHPAVLFTLLSDQLELSSLQECNCIFDFVERHFAVWKEPLFLNSGKNAVLRMCNDLLRRLSRAQNTILCGRILIFLSNYFPFSERSALNIMSEFNSDNVTEYKTSDGEDDPEDRMEVETEKEGLFEGLEVNLPGLDQIISAAKEENLNKTKVDYSLYVKFWSLQDFFRNPTKVYDKFGWKNFSLYIGDVLSGLQSFKMDDCVNTLKAKKRESDIPTLSNNTPYFAKYLTNKRLLELQMSDPSFRRHFLIQLLIIMQYLTAPVKFKSDAHTLNEEQAEFVKGTQEKVYALLEKTPPDGKQFVVAVKHVLSREVLWNQWKNDGCPQFKKPTATKGNEPVMSEERLVDEESGDKTDKPEARKTKRRQLGDVMHEAEQSGRFLLGNSELTRLWNICGDNLEACRSQSRDFTPSIDTFFADAFQEIDTDVVSSDAKKAPANKKILGNPNFGWRALRLLAQKSPFFFQMHSGSPVNRLQDYLEFVLKKHVAERDATTASFTPDRSSKGTGVKPETSGSSTPVKKGNEDQDAEVEGEVEDDEEMMADARVSDDEEEDGEVKHSVDPNLRNLTEAEMTILGTHLGSNWKTLGTRLGYKVDEMNFFEESSSNPCLEMLRRWTEDEGEEASVADLVYKLEGLKQTDVIAKVFPSA